MKAEVRIAVVGLDVESHSVAMQYAAIAAAKSRGVKVILEAPARGQRYDAVLVGEEVSDDLAGRCAQLKTSGLQVGQSAMAGFLRAILPLVDDVLLEKALGR